MKTMTKRQRAVYDALSGVCRKENPRIKKLPLGKNDKYAVFSDLHLGNGGLADNFAHNERITKVALEYYKKNRYSVILLGDIEEFWQFDYKQVLGRYESGIYSLLRSFKKGSVHRINGNHDREWGGLPDPLEANAEKIFGYPEGIMLDDYIFLVHGHQGDVISDRIAWMSRFGVRLFKYIEPIARIFGYENKSAPRTQIPKDHEYSYYCWAKDKKKILVCGHTHRAMFASHSYYQWLLSEIQHLRIELNKTKEKSCRKKLVAGIREYRTEAANERNRGRRVNPLEPDGEPLPCYFNSGSGLYSNGITSLEIEQKVIRLIKWDSSSQVAPEKSRVTLWGEGDLQSCRDRVCGRNES